MSENSTDQKTKQHRRRFLQFAGAGTLGLAAGGTLLPGTARAQAPPCPTPPLDGVINVLSCSAASDREKIQDAIDTAPEGGTVWIPPGVYQIDQPIRINKPVNVVRKAIFSSTSSFVNLIFIKGLVIYFRNGVFFPIVYAQILV